MNNYEEPTIDYDTNEEQETSKEKNKKLRDLYRKFLKELDDTQGSAFSKTPHFFYKTLDQARDAGFDYPDLINRFHDMRRDDFWKDKNITCQAILKSLITKPPQK